MLDLQTDDCQPTCIPDCEWIFDRVRVRPTIQHGAHVEWRMHPQFEDPEPHAFQLQAGTTGLRGADDWVNVGLPAENAFYLLDDQQRIFGKTQWIHYRIKLTTSVGIYYSAPQHAWGDLKFRFWRKLRAVQRLWSKKLRLTHMGQEGFLLKRKIVGAQPEPGQGSIDYLTFENVNPQNPDTVGTEYLGGYYDPVPCIYATLDRVIRREHLDKLGTENRIVVKARMLATPQLDEEDVWVDKDTDFRWYLHRIEHLVEVQGIPAVVQAELRLAPFMDPVYGIEIASQLPV